MKKGLEVMIQLVATSLALVAVLATGIPACQLACRATRSRSISIDFSSN